jgi:hypothetical protein
MFARLSLAAVATLILAVPAPANHYPGHPGSIYGSRNGTGSNFYPSQPGSGSDAWNQPRRPSLQYQWSQPPGTNAWEQPRKPDLYPWGKPKY